MKQINRLFILLYPVHQHQLVRLPIAIFSAQFFQILLQIKRKSDLLLRHLEFFQNFINFNDLPLQTQHLPFNRTAQYRKPQWNSVKPHFFIFIFIFSVILHFSHLPPRIFLFTPPTPSEFCWIKPRLWFSYSTNSAYAWSTPNCPDAPPIYFPWAPLKSAGFRRRI